MLGQNAGSAVRAKGLTATEFLFCVVRLYGDISSSKMPLLLSLPLLVPPVLLEGGALGFPPEGSVWDCARAAESCVFLAEALLPSGGMPSVKDLADEVGPAIWANSAFNKPPENQWLCALVCFDQWATAWHSMKEQAHMQTRDLKLTDWPQ